MWKNVVNSINLSEKQKHDVVSWKQMFMQKVGGAGCGPRGLEGPGGRLGAPSGCAAGGAPRPTQPSLAAPL
jgi:hypothetical protein